MLKWLHANFAGMRIVFVLRHPCAVANSRMKLGWGAPLERFLSQGDLVEDHLRPFANEIGQAQDPFDRQVFMWCIENYVPLRQFQRGEIHVVFYETLCSSPGREVGELFRFLGKAWDPRVLRNVGRPSSVARRDGVVLSGNALIDTWRKNISETQIRRAVCILGLFGLDAVYSGYSNPQGDALREHGGQAR